MKKSIISAALLLAGIYNTQAFASGIQVELALPQATFAASNDVNVQVTYVNNGTKPEKILKWYTPEGAVKEDLFDISVNGMDAPYTGMHIKRAAPTSRDYLTLKPGQKLSYTVELTSLYDLPASGNYEIKYHVETLALHDIPKQLTRAQEQAFNQSLVAAPLPNLRSEAVFAQIEVDNKLRADLQQPSLVTLAGSVSYAANCSSSRRTSIATAMTSAKTYASNSANYLTNYATASRANSVRYKTWFGSYTSTRWTTVNNNFKKISSALQNQAIQFDCGCTDSYFAYVYPNQPYKIYLCSAFWSAPNTGTDSKAGTIVHETSHFTVVAATDDIAYGQTAAKNLAVSNPSQAVKNADSHEYFAENTPAQN
jgi:peptidyl-Lys metalloendopeptidase